MSGEESRKGAITRLLAVKGGCVTALKTCSKQGEAIFHEIDDMRMVLKAPKLMTSSWGKSDPGVAEERGS